MLIEKIAELNARVAELETIVATLLREKMDKERREKRKTEREAAGLPEFDC